VDGKPVPLLDQPEFRDGASEAQLQRLAVTLRGYASDSYIVFARSEENYAMDAGVGSAGALQGLERTVASSPLFTLWHAVPDARIYELRPVAAVATLAPWSSRSTLGPPGFDETMRCPLCLP
jgi:hypothetical protein